MAKKKPTASALRGTKEWRQLQKSFLAQAKPIIKRLQQGRDDLRALVDEYGDILEQCDGGLFDIEHGIDSISGLI
jgi:hypothetical protein